MPSVRRPSLVFAAVAAAALAIAPPAAARRTIKLKVPRFVVPPRTDREVCTFVRVPMKQAFDLGGSVIVNVGGRGSSFTTHHFLMWVYEGKDIDRFPPRGQLVYSNACLDFGPTDTNQRTLIGGAQQPRLETRLPTGLAQQIKPTVSGGQAVAGIILNSHWINGDDTPHKAAVKVTLMAAPKHSVRQLLLPLFDVVANGFIKVPPVRRDQDGQVVLGDEESVNWTWAPGGLNFGGGLGGGAFPTGPACVVALTSHMHKRGVLFTIDFLDHNQVSRRECYPHEPPGRCLTAKDYTDPPQNKFDGQGGDPPPLLVNVGQGLRYTCTHDNGMNRPVKMGCEEKAPVPCGATCDQSTGKCNLPPDARGVTPSCSKDQDCSDAQCKKAGGQVCTTDGLCHIPPGVDAAMTVLSGHGTKGAAKRCETDANCTPTDPDYPGRSFTGKCVPANLVFGYTSDDDMCIMPGAWYPANAAGSCDLNGLPLLN